MEKIDSHTLNEDERFIIRKTAINLINKGEKKKDVASYFEVRPSSISEWVKKHEDRGNKGLKTNKRGAVSEDRKLLSQEQEKEIQVMIIDRMPDQ